MGEEFLNKDEADKGEIVIYQPDEITRLEVKVNDDTVWLTQSQMSLLFQRNQSVIARHIKNIFDEKELIRDSNMQILHNTLSKFKPVSIYSLDVIISVGYRVKSLRGTQFRQWANKVLKDYLLNGYAIRHRLNEFEDRIDRRMLQFDKRLDEQERKMDILVHSSQLPKQGIFYDGQIYDAYAFVSDLIGASIKDLGKKWFGFTLMENTSADELLRRM